MGGKYVLCQEQHPWLNLTADFYMLFLIPLFRRTSLRPQGGTDCLVQLGHENALYEMLPSTQSKTREDGKISPLTRNLVCYLWQWGTNNTQQKDDFFQGDRTVFKLDAWLKHIVSACEAFLRVAEQTRPDQTVWQSHKGISSRNTLSLSLCIHTHILYNLSQQHAKANTKLPAIFQRDGQSSQILSMLPPGTILCFH